MCTIVPKIPIFLTVRGNTKKIYDKNYLSLKYSYLFIKEQNLFSQTFVISDNIKLLDYSRELGFINQIYYPCGNDKDIKYLEYLAIYRYSIENNYHPDWFIILNIDQLFRSNNLVYRCINNIDDNYDVITSYTVISNRNNFIINEETGKVNIKKHLLTSEKERVKMLDSSIYAVKSDFAFECMKYDDPSQIFWNGKFKFFENKDLYTDIYNIEDIKKFDFVKKQLDKIKES